MSQEKSKGAQVSQIGAWCLWCHEVLTRPSARIWAVMVVVVIFSFALASCEDVDSESSFVEDANAPIPEKVPVQSGQFGQANPSIPPLGSSPPINPSLNDPLLVVEEGCGDGICQPSETKCSCEGDCGQCAGDASPTTQFHCSDGKCRIVPKEHVCGNGACEDGESSSSCPGDCPVCEPDNDPCTKDAFNGLLKACAHDPIIPCCGNKVCEPPGESASCLIDCKPAVASLSDYPKPFVLGNKINTLIVIGSRGTGADVAAAIDIIRGWGYNGSNPGYDGKAKLDKEIDSLQGKNAILIGNACENSFVDSLMKPNRDCRDGLEPGVGLLRLYKTGSDPAGADTFALVVAGVSGEETRHAARVLEKYQNYGLNGFQVEVR